MKNLLASSSFLVVNKLLAQKIGIKPSILLADLISKETYFVNVGQCVEGYFFNSADNIKNDTTLSRYEQTKAIKILEKIGFIETKLQGIPAVKHFKINENNIIKFLDTSFKEIKKLDCKIVKDNNNKKIIFNNNIDILKEEVNNFDTTEKHKKDFLEYWLEPSKSGKTRFEMQKTWCTKRRLKTWINNYNSWYEEGLVKLGKIDTQINEYEKGKQYL